MTLMLTLVIMTNLDAARPFGWLETLVDDC